jgi:hypothetical protein
MYIERIVSRRRVVAGLLGCAALVCGPASTGIADTEVMPDAPVVQAPNICGSWDCGSWRSFCNSHHGKLRATISRCDACHYKCTFSGTFFGIIPFRYTATLTVTGYGDGVVYFRSSRNMPMFGGQFSMCGQATSCRFTANYRSPKDKGVFSMTR